MGLKIGADLDVKAVLEIMGRMEKRQEETNRRLREYLTKPHANHRFLYNNVQVPASVQGNLAIDLGQVPGGLQWEVEQVDVFANDPFTQAAGTATVQANQQGTAAAAPITLTVPAQAGKTNQVSGFQVTGDGATAGSIIVVTLSGVQGGTQSFDLTIPAGAGVPITPLIVTFNPPLVASGPNTAIVLTVPSFGAGNTNAAAELDAQVVSGGQVVAAVFQGRVPSPEQLVAGASPSDGVIAPALSVPVVQQFGGRIAVLRGAQTHLYVVVSNQGGLSLLSTIHATASVVEVPDTEECLTWL
jgi:hypothetical protein